MTNLKETVMKGIRVTSIPLKALFLALCIVLASCGRPHDAGGTPPATNTANQAQSAAQAQSDFQQRQMEAEQQARPDIERQRREAEQQAEQSLDQDAISAIEDTQNAIRAIAGNNTSEALAAIERATGKINILLARNPATALIPVNAEVEVIDTAPVDVQAIRERVMAVERAVSARDYPAARVLLNGLASEIRVRTYNLPLGTYPAALQEAARLLDQNRPQDAGMVLLTALNTLVMIDRVIPLPLVIAQAAINDAEALRDNDKDGAQRLLTIARNELDRARELGYAGNDPEYAALNQAITDLEVQVRSTGDTASVFTRIKERVAAFFKRQSQNERR
jgi:hypothetical protein